MSLTFLVLVVPRRTVLEPWRKRANTGIPKAPWAVHPSNHEVSHTLLDSDLSPPFTTVTYLCTTEPFVGFDLKRGLRLQYAWIYELSIGVLPIPIHGPG